MLPCIPSTALLMSTFSSQVTHGSWNLCAFRFYALFWSTFYLLKLLLFFNLNRCSQPSTACLLYASWRYHIVLATLPPASFQTSLQLKPGPQKISTKQLQGIDGARCSLQAGCPSCCNSVDTDEINRTRSGSAVQRSAHCTATQRSSVHCNPRPVRNLMGTFHLAALPAHSAVTSRPGLYLVKCT